MEIENESFENYCPMMQNILDIYKIETFTKFSEITKSILSSMNLQVDEFLNRRKMSGNYPSDYLSEKSLKPFIVEPIKEFNHQECPTIEFSSPSFGYLGEIDRCWLYHENTIYFWDSNNPKKTYICYPVDIKVDIIFLFPVKRDIANNRIIYLCAIASKEIMKICVAHFQFNTDDDFNDFYANIRDSIDFRHTFSYTCAKQNSKLRIYFGATNQIIYELKYQIDEDKKLSCEFIDVTTPSIASLIPSILYNLLESNSILQIEIDSSNILYALDFRSNIHIYKIGNDFERLKKIDTLTLPQIDLQCSLFLKKRNFFLNASIIKIYAVEKFESRYIQLIILFSNGFRAFISNTPDSTSSEITTSCLSYRVVHLRQPPYDDFSAVTKIHSAFLRLETFILCTDYESSCRLWCMCKSIRCSSELYQESLTIYTLDKPLFSIKIANVTQLIKPMPQIYSHCYVPKNRFSIQLQDMIPFPILVGNFNATEALRITNKKSYEILTSIYQMKNYSESIEFLSYTNRTTDIEFNVACFTILGKLPETQENFALLILDDIWESSYMYEVDFIKNNVYKRTVINLNSQPISDSNRFLILHGDIQNLKIPFNWETKIKRCSFLFYTLLLHSLSYLMCIWDSRIMYQTSTWNISMGLQDTKTTRETIGELLICIKRIISFYEGKLNDRSFLQIGVFSSDVDAVDFDADLKLAQTLEFLVNITLQWLHIWTGIMAIDYFDFFNKSNLFEEFKTLTFSDLIFNQSQLTIELIWKFLFYVRTNKNVFDFFTRNWPKDAILYFTNDCKNVAHANNRLLDAVNTQNQEIRQRDLAFAIETYHKHLNCLDLRWICNILIKLNYHPNAVSLCLNTYSYFLTHESSLTDKDIKRSRAIRMKISEILFFVLNDSYNKYKNIQKTDMWSVSCEHGSDFHSKNLKCSALAALEEAEDEYISHQIFDWILYSDLSYMLIHSSSIFLSNYLNDVDFKELTHIGLKKARCLYEFYECRKDFLLAALQLYKIASASINIHLLNNDVILLSLEEREDFLRLALAQVSLSPISTENSTLLSDINQKLRLIDLQREVFFELENELHEPRYKESQFESDLNKLKFCERKLINNILSEKSLLTEVILPCQLSISYLLIIKLLGEKYIDFDYLLKIWNFLFQQLLDITVGKFDSKVKADSLAQFKMLISRFGQNRHCFPIHKLLYEFEIRVSRTNLEHCWLPELFIKHAQLSYTQYAYYIQEYIYNLVQAGLEDSFSMNHFQYLFDSYIYISGCAFEDLSNSSFSNAVKMFNEYIETKVLTLSISPSDMRKIKAKILSLNNLVLSFYEKRTDTNLL